MNADIPFYDRKKGTCNNLHISSSIIINNTFWASKRIMSYMIEGFYCLKRSENMKLFSYTSNAIQKYYLHRVDCLIFHTMSKHSFLCTWKNYIDDQINISRLLFWYKFCHLLLIPWDQLYKKGLTKSIIKSIHQEIHPFLLPKYVCMMWHCWPEFILCWL